jgi:spermidine synthase
MNEPMGTLPLQISLLIMGISGIVAQILLLREFLISFFGNELTLGIILANWLILEAAGSFILGRTVEKTERKIEAYVLLQLIFSLALPFAIYLSRIVKNLLLVTPGEGLGFIPIFYSSFLILLLVSIPHGALFTYGCKIYALDIREDASSIGKVYVLETIGSIMGGLGLTLLLVQHLNSFEIAFLISLMNALVSVVLLWPTSRSSRHPAQTFLWVLSGLLSLVFAYSLLPQTSSAIHRSSVRSQWKELHVIHNENSIYGNITITQRGEQFTFFTDGVPSLTTPVPDVASIEDFVHFPMLFHEKPELVLVLSGGAGGMIQEILKYPVAHVDYVELDPLLLKLIRKFPTPLTQAELSDPRVKIHYTDGRFFVQRTRDRFDLIFIGLSSPQELQTNRLFTSEFYSLAKQKMNPGAIIVLTLPGSLTYLSPELKDLNGCILETLKKVYRHIRIIPGDVNLYLASDAEELEGITIEELVLRLEGRKIRTSLFTKGYLEVRLHERWTNWFFQSMGKREVHINSDFQPLAVFFNLSYWNALFSPSLTKIFKWFEGFRLKGTIAATGLLTLLFLILFIKKPQFSKYSLPYAIFASGFADMMITLAILFTFQTLYGYLYYQIGLLVTVFMAGIALGSLFITRQLGRIKKPSSLFLKTEAGIIFFSLLLPFVLIFPSHHLDQPFVYILLYTTFLVLSCVCGVLVGLQFPLATKIYLSVIEKDGALGQTAGLLYGADLFGGFFGGLLGGVLLLPILGLKESCFMMAAIKGSSFLLFLLFTKIRK